MQDQLFAGACMEVLIVRAGVIGVALRAVDRLFARCVRGRWSPCCPQRVLGAQLQVAVAACCSGVANCCVGVNGRSIADAHYLP
jgi:hypothetical protein